MKNRSFILCAGLFFSVLIFFSSCKKINEATELGDDLIPAVDNVTTFDTTLEVQAFNELFTTATDSTRTISTDEHFVGYINSDPLFGKTTANLFLQLKPDFSLGHFSFPFKSIDSLIALDSIVLVLSYHDTYGDSTTPQRFRVFEMDKANTFRADSFYQVRVNNFTYTNQLGNRTFTPTQLKDSIFPFREAASNQLRIKLDNTFGNRLLHYDSTTSTTSGAYSTDSAFSTFVKGFAVVPDLPFGGKAALGFSLTDTNTKLSIYFRYKDGKDTATVTNFFFTGSSASANYVQRDYAGFPINTVQGGTTQDNLVYIQSTPGSFARLKIPALTNLSNRIVHRAELIVEQVRDGSDDMFPTPQFLFLDAYDPIKSAYRSIPYDVAFNSDGSLNYQSFGMLGKDAVDPFGSGKTIKIWKFNLSRYVQHIATKTETNYELRLSAPLDLIDLFKSGTTDVTPSPVFNVNPTILKGRVRVGGGTHPQRMRLHIIYSKI